MHTETPASRSNYERPVFVLFLLLLAAGLFLRFYQYLMGRSLWEDETHLALNFMKYGFGGLSRPLDHMQGAPIFFLYAVKLAVLCFGYGELAFRLVPFLFSIGSLPLFFFAVKDLTQKPWVALIAFALFSLNVALVYFASELKPYAVDVSFYVILLYVYVSRNAFVLRHKTLLLALSGCLAILFSLSGFIVAFCVACCLVRQWLINKKLNPSDLKIMIPWAAVFAINYFLFIHNHPSTEGQRYNYASAFCPANPFSPEFASFMHATVQDVFFNSLLYVSKDAGFAYGLLFILLLSIGYLLITRKTELIIFTLLPLLIHLGLSVLHIYPFVYRLILYLIPSFVMLIAIGLWLIAGFIAKRLHPVAGVAAALLCLYFFTKESLMQFPLHSREIMPTLVYMNDSLPRAHVYAFDPVNAYTYYYKRGQAINAVYAEVPWEIDPPEYYNLVKNETSDYLIVYGERYWWGYGDVLEDLKQKNLVVKTFAYKGYAVSEIRPKPKDSLDNLQILNYKNFDPALTVTNDKLIALWGGTITSTPVIFNKGLYSISLVSSGTPVDKVYPHQNILIGDRAVAGFDATQFFSRQTFSFDIARDTTLPVKIRMTNDAATEKEDRNTFIKNLFIMLEKPGETAH